MKDVVKESLIHILNFIHLNRVLDAKNEAVKNQNYKLAHDLRVKEIEFRKKLPSELVLNELIIKLDEN